MWYGSLLLDYLSLFLPKREEGHFEATLKDEEKIHSLKKKGAKKKNETNQT